MHEFDSKKYDRIKQRIAQAEKWAQGGDKLGSSY